MTDDAGPADPDRILDHEGWPGRWEILETADETNGERFKPRMEIEPIGTQVTVSGNPRDG